MDDQPTIIFELEKTGMASCRTIKLGISELADGKWKLAEYSQKIVGNFYELIPEDDQWDENGEIRIPDQVGGTRVIGVEDGEWLYTDDLVEEASVNFCKDSLCLAEKFLRDYGYDRTVEFAHLWRRILFKVNIEKY